MRPKELAQALLRQAGDRSGNYPDWMRQQWREAAAELERLTDVSAIPAQVLTDEGGLDRVSPDVHWVPGDEKVTLNGEFTPSELRAIATHMEAPLFAPYA